MFEHMLHDIRGRSSTKMGGNTARSPWAASHFEGLYFLGKGGILPITNRCDPVLSVPQIRVIGLQRPNVRGLTLGALDRATVWRYWMVLR
jgi:hypothetical protein